MNKMNIGKILKWMIHQIEEKGIVTDASVYSRSITMTGVTEDGLRITIRVEEDEKNDTV